MLDLSKKGSFRDLRAEQVDETLASADQNLLD